MQPLLAITVGLPLPADMLRLKVGHDVGVRWLESGRKGLGFRWGGCGASHLKDCSICRYSIHFICPMLLTEKVMLSSGSDEFTGTM